MNGRFRVDYMNPEGRRLHDVLGSQALAITYAIAYEESGYRVQGVTNEATGEAVDYTRMPIEEIHIGTTKTEE